MALVNFEMVERAALKCSFKWAKQKIIKTTAKPILQMKTTIQPANGKLGILMVGLGAVSTTLIAGVMAIRKGTDLPIGSLTQLGTIRLGKRTEKRNPLVKDFVPLAQLNDIAFGAWDIFEDNAYESALKAAVLDEYRHLHALRE